MAVKDGSGPRPAHSTKRCFLNCLEASFKPSICLPSCIASFQKLAVFFFCPPPSFETHSKLARRQASKRPVAKARKERPSPQSNSMALRDGTSPGNGLCCLTLLSERTLAAGNFSSEALPLLQVGSADKCQIYSLTCRDKTAKNIM